MAGRPKRRARFSREAARKNAYVRDIGYVFDSEERAVFLAAQAKLSEAMRGGVLTGVKQNAVADLLRSLQPGFSEGELRAAIRLSDLIPPHRRSNPKKKLSRSEYAAMYAANEICWWCGEIGCASLCAEIYEREQQERKAARKKRRKWDAGQNPSRPEFSIATNQTWGEVRTWKDWSEKKRRLTSSYGSKILHQLQLVPYKSLPTFSFPPFLAPKGTTLYEWARQTGWDRRRSPEGI